MVGGWREGAGALQSARELEADRNRAARRKRVPCLRAWNDGGRLLLYLVERRDVPYRARDRLRIWVRP